jgi:ATP-dependent protease HslVU (ClpYQ) ATPase subunit
MIAFACGFLLQVSVRFGNDDDDDGGGSDGGAAVEGEQEAVGLVGVSRSRVLELIDGLVVQLRGLPTAKFHLVGFMAKGLEKMVEVSLRTSVWGRRRQQQQQQQQKQQQQQQQQQQQLHRQHRHATASAPAIEDAMLFDATGASFQYNTAEQQQQQQHQLQHHQHQHQHQHHIQHYTTASLEPNLNVMSGQQQQQQQHQNHLHHQHPQHHQDDYNTFNSTNSDAAQDDTAFMMPDFGLSNSFLPFEDAVFRSADFSYF